MFAIHSTDTSLDGGASDEAFDAWSSAYHLITNGDGGRPTTWHGLVAMLALLVDREVDEFRSVDGAAAEYLRKLVEAGRALTRAGDAA